MGIKTGRFLPRTSAGGREGVGERNTRRRGKGWELGKAGGGGRGPAGGAGVTCIRGAALPCLNAGFRRPRSRRAPSQAAAAVAGSCTPRDPAEGSSHARVTARRQQPDVSSSSSLDSGNLDSSAGHKLGGGTTEAHGRDGRGKREGREREFEEGVGRERDEGGRRQRRTKGQEGNGRVESRATSGGREAEGRARRGDSHWGRRKKKEPNGSHSAEGVRPVSKREPPRIRTRGAEGLRKRPMSATAASPRSSPGLPAQIAAPPIPAMAPSPVQIRGAVARGRGQERGVRRPHKQEANPPVPRGEGGRRKGRKKKRRGVKEGGRTCKALLCCSAARRVGRRGAARGEIDCWDPFQRGDLTSEPSEGGVAAGNGGLQRRRERRGGNTINAAMRGQGVLQKLLREGRKDGLQYRRGGCQANGREGGGGGGTWIG